MCPKFLCVFHILWYMLSWVLLLGKAQTKQTRFPNQKAVMLLSVNIAMTCLFPWFRVSPVEIYTGKLSTTLLSHGSLYSCLATSVAWEPGGRTLHTRSLLGCILHRRQEKIQTLTEHLFQGCAGAGSILKFLGALQTSY